MDHNELPKAAEQSLTRRLFPRRASPAKHRKHRRASKKIEAGLIREGADYGELLMAAHEARALANEAELAAAIAKENATAAEAEADAADPSLSWVQTCIAARKHDAALARLALLKRVSRPSPLPEWFAESIPAEESLKEGADHDHAEMIPHHLICQAFEVINDALKEDGSSAICGEWWDKHEASLIEHSGRRILELRLYGACFHFEIERLTTGDEAVIEMVHLDEVVA
jgi:hypothetical protein